MATNLRAVMPARGRAQIYNPETDSFTTVAGAPTIDYYQVVGNHYLARLRDGRVLIVTGQGRDAWLFDSDEGTFRMPVRVPPPSVAFANGMVVARGPYESGVWDAGTGRQCHSIRDAVKLQRR